ncbi:hypothetical protein BSKO_13691 [Bryopsis sp. KO-2023]|nr:hypothetical protein BSKO_13691 [Bryopsis sp. KO-2023]
MSFVVGEDKELFEALESAFDYGSHTCLRLPQQEQGFDDVRIYAGRLLGQRNDGTLAYYTVTNSLQRSDGGCGDFTCGNSRCPDCNNEMDSDEELEDWECAVSPGNCLTPVQFEGTQLWMLTRQEGPPIPQGGCGDAVKFIEIVLFAPGRNSIDILKRFVETARVEVRRSRKGNKFTLYRWQLKGNFWKRYGDHAGRDPKTLILPKDMCAEVLEDVKDFFSIATRKWYMNFGIPYKRSLLLYGPPGSGKSSVIKMIASECGRSVCYLQPAGMSDAALADAMEDLPRRTVLVLEDVDALFAAGRESAKKQKLTFSGVLNALDGLISPQNGQLIVMTSNHPERLDPAMIRCGRVDRRFELSAPTCDQAVRMFNAFYPEAASTDGGQAAGKKFGEMCMETSKSIDYPLSMASLQNYFIMGRKLGYKEFLEKLPEFIEDEQAIAVMIKKAKCSKNSKNKKGGKKMEYENGDQTAENDKDDEEDSDGSGSGSDSDASDEN